MAEAHNSLGNVLRAKGQHQEAISEYRTSLRLKDDNPEAHYNLGICLRDLEQMEEAIKSFRRAVELDPGFVDAANDLGCSLRQTRQLEESAVVLSQAVAKAPDIERRKLTSPAAVAVWAGGTDDIEIDISGTKNIGMPTPNAICGGMSCAKLMFCAKVIR